MPHTVLCDLCADPVLARQWQELEASYNATGMLCHLLAEGKGLWAAHNLQGELDRVIDTLIKTVRRGRERGDPVGERGVKSSGPLQLRSTVAPLLILLMAFSLSLSRCRLTLGCPRQRAGSITAA